MANYFSNHSASRFLANSANTAQTTASNAPPANAPAPTNNGPPRPRIPSSKHFSTTVATTTPAASKDVATSSSPASATATQVHPLRNTWVFWFRQQRTPGNKIISYEEGIKKIAAFSSVESFWSLWTHLAPPSALQPTTDYLLFHTGIRRPVWEDPLNIQGGKWIIRLKKGVADRFWEDLVLAIIGDQFDDCRSRVEDNPRTTTTKSSASSAPQSEDGSDSSSTTEWPEICGCTISVRQSEDIVTIWNRVDGDPKLREQIRDTLRKVLNLPASTVMEYKSNNDSMQDKSSFRRTTSTTIDKTPISSAS
ncbi:eukaryotic translation initiation factor 4E [Pholiota conissans]|uniref:Eukaryotic translation initiation factor 4E n=1 Tax=Pholiota conissans TaxID=109636 RepID=A0A9P5Z4H5_9AGAR|nr:eukaryotic translation initiation factor 4E [Pholiota conissans]